jgi:hypothetical protein
MGDREKQPAGCDNIVIPSNHNKKGPEIFISGPFLFSLFPGFHPAGDHPEERMGEQVFQSPQPVILSAVAPEAFFKQMLAFERHLPTGYRNSTAPFKAVDFPRIEPISSANCLAINVPQETADCCWRIRFSSEARQLGMMRIACCQACEDFLRQ